MSLAFRFPSLKRTPLAQSWIRHCSLPHALETLSVLPAIEMILTIAVNVPLMFYTHETNFTALTSG